MPDSPEIRVAEEIIGFAVLPTRVRTLRCAKKDEDFRLPRTMQSNNAKAEAISPVGN